MSHEIVELMGALEEQVAKVGGPYLIPVEVVRADGCKWHIYVPDEYIDAVDSKKGELEELVRRQMERIVGGWSTSEKSLYSDSFGFQGWDAFCRIRLSVVSEDNYEWRRSRREFFSSWLVDSTTSPNECAL
jgi:hypothetical protein